MNPTTQPRQVIFDPTPEIFATDSSGSFVYPLVADGDGRLKTLSFDEARFLISLWHPGGGRGIDLDRAYVELQGSFGDEEEHWIKLAEIEPVVPPYDSGSRFDGWIVLPIFGASSRYQIVGGGFDARARIQIRASVYLVA